MADDIQLVAFKIGEEEFSIPILSVQEIIRMVDITRLPNVPDFVEGVINLRGKVIPVVDLRKRFGLPHRERDGGSRIIIVNLHDKAGNAATVGLIVDSVSEVLRLDTEAIETIAGVETGIGAEYIKGVGKAGDRLIILLDIEKILSTEERDMLYAMDQGL